MLIIVLKTELNVNYKIKKLELDVNYSIKKFDVDYSIKILNRMLIVVLKNEIGC